MRPTWRHREGATRVFLVFALLVSVVSAQSPAQAPASRPASRPAAESRPAFPWRKVPCSVPGIEVNQLTLAGPVELTLAEVKLDRAELAVKSFRSKHPTGKDSLLSTVKSNGAVLAVNTHFFDMEKSPTIVLGWDVGEGLERTAPFLSIVRSKRAVAVSRAAIWWCEGAIPEFGWVAQEGDARIALEKPLSGRELTSAAGGPAPSAQPGARRLVGVREAVGAGPMLLRHGALTITRGEERMFESEDVRHPRTAVGLKADGVTLVFLVVDGRYPGSLGMTLGELAKTLRVFGVSDAINLDGGGSTTMVLEGRVVNKPLGAALLRAVPTGLGVFRKAS